MGGVRDSLGQLIARYLQKPVRGYDAQTSLAPRSADENAGAVAA